MGNLSETGSRRSEYSSTTSGRTIEIPAPAGSKGYAKNDKKRKRESVESDRGRPDKRSNKREQEHHKSFCKDQHERDAKDELSRQLQRSSHHGGLSGKGRVYAERPARTGGKRKIESVEKEEEEERKNKKKCEENEPAELPSVIVPLGLSHFRFHQELGRGAFGTVLLASLKSKNTTVAVKAIANTKVAAVLREQRVLRRTSGNPYLCHAYAGFQTQTHCFFVMEHLTGGDLEQMLEATGPLDLRTTTICTAEIICGIQYLHQLGVIHNDLKTNNIIIDRQGHVRICDFGMAAENIFGDQTTTGWGGTIYYMAPEMLRRDPYGLAVDWWAFGVILYRLFTNKYPFSGVKTKTEYVLKVQSDEPTYPKQLTKEAKDILQRFFCKDWQQRLGWHGNVRQHPFYRGINWEKIENKTAEPPFLPRLGQNNYSALSQPLSLSFLNTPERNNSPPDANPIQDFSFVDPEWSF
ncbi:protein kinase C delta type-like [Rhinoderma darwinii]|uniref:protein kinase C delta type-like n=1 Tax=Rhinoderma darwinii TaxID=43563 RepID=UPI003F679A53